MNESRSCMSRVSHGSCSCWGDELLARLPCYKDGRENRRHMPQDASLSLSLSFPFNERGSRLLSWLTHSCSYLLQKQRNSSFFFHLLPHLSHFHDLLSGFFLDSFVADLVFAATFRVDVDVVVTCTLCSRHERLLRL